MRSPPNDRTGHNCLHLPPRSLLLLGSRCNCCSCWGEEGAWEDKDIRLDLLYRQEVLSIQAVVHLACWAESFLLQSDAGVEVHSCSYSVARAVEVPSSFRAAPSYPEGVDPSCREAVAEDRPFREEVEALVDLGSSVGSSSWEEVAVGWARVEAHLPCCRVRAGEGAEACYRDPGEGAEAWHPDPGVVEEAERRGCSPTEPPRRGEVEASCSWREAEEEVEEPRAGERPRTFDVADPLGREDFAQRADVLPPSRVCLLLSLF